MRQIELEVITPILGSFDHCPHCQVFIDSSGIGGQIHQNDLDSYPPEMKMEFHAISDLVMTLGERYGANLVIRVIDPGSIRGLWTAIRHRIKRYPTFIVEHSDPIVGIDQERIENAIRSRLTPRPGELA